MKPLKTLKNNEMENYDENTQADSDCQQRLVRRVKVMGRSHTTGSVMQLDLSEEEYDNRYNRIPAWNIESETAIFYMPNTPTQERTASPDVTCSETNPDPKE